MCCAILPVTKIRGWKKKVRRSTKIFIRLFRLHTLNGRLLIDAVAAQPMTLWYQRSFQIASWIDYVVAAGRISSFCYKRKGLSIQVLSVWEKVRSTYSTYTHSCIVSNFALLQQANQVDFRKSSKGDPIPCKKLYQKGKVILARWRARKLLLQFA